MNNSTIQRKAITSFEVIDHGIDGAQYFQGCGVSYTAFDDVATGCGENAKEAFNDALESLAQNDWDVDSIEASEDGAMFNSVDAERASVEAYLSSHGYGDERDEDCELYYYVSIRVA